MALSKFLRCFLCEREKGEDSRPVVPIQYDIKGKNPQRSPADSEDSFYSEAESVKEDKAVRTSIAAKEIQQEVERRNRALVVASKGCYDYMDHPFPTMAHEKEVVIANRATGLNPIDHKSVDYNFCLPEFPWITGREMAGVVEAVGSEVEGLKVGDKVWTSTYYRDRRAGCFQQFVTVPEHTVLPIPSNITFNTAACLGVAGLTAAMTLWRWLEVPMFHSETNPTSSPEYLLIWGGSTVTGQFATQLASSSGLKVISVTSAKTKSLSERLGAEAVVRDGKTDEEIVRAVREMAGDNITRAIDLVGAKTATFCLQALSTSKPSIFAPLAMLSSQAIIPENVRVETVEMKQFVLNPESRKYALELNRLVEEGKLVLPSIEVLEGGLDVVQRGLERLKAGDMAGRKMVVSMA